MSISSLNEAITDLQDSMSQLDDKNNNSIFHCGRNGRAARSAENLTRVLKQVTSNLNLKSKKYLDGLIEPLKKVNGLVAKYNRMHEKGGFDRTWFFCIGRKSNTKVKLKEALESLCQLRKLYEAIPLSKEIERGEKIWSTLCAQSKMGTMLDTPQGKQEKVRKSFAPVGEPNLLPPPPAVQKPVIEISDDDPYMLHELRESRRLEEDLRKGCYPDRGQHRITPAQRRVEREFNNCGDWSDPTPAPAKIDLRSAREIRMDEYL